MRAIVEPQLRLAAAWIDHPHAVELAEMSRILDEHPELAAMAHADLVRGRSSRRGRRGLSGDQVLRIIVLKQLNGTCQRF